MELINAAGGLRQVSLRRSRGSILQTPFCETRWSGHWLIHAPAAMTSVPNDGSRREAPQLVVRQQQRPRLTSQACHSASATRPPTELGTSWRHRRDRVARRTDTEERPVLLLAARDPGQTQKLPELAAKSLDANVGPELVKLRQGQKRS